MIDLPANIEDRAAYPLVAESERWIFNKLILSEKLGYRCAPCGTLVEVAGPVCRRPIMNCAGRGLGGVLKFESVAAMQPDNDETIRGGLTQPPYAAGYFWCEWFDGYHSWVDFTDDIPVRWWGGHEINGRIVNNKAPASPLTTLPTVLQGVSKHLMVESLGDKIIEASPRHMTLEFGTMTGSAMVKIKTPPPWGSADEEDSFYWRNEQISPNRRLDALG